MDSVAITKTPTYPRASAPEYCKRLKLAGSRYGRLLVLCNGLNDRFGKSRWLCRCDCGVEKVVLGSNLINGRSQSCGCLQKELVSKRVLSHGMTHTPTYRAWTYMRNRCLNPNHKNYKHYGGRGITICDRWSSFESFYTDMGDKPKGQSLDRIDNDGNYEPSNCRWAPWVVQANNSRKNRLFTHQNKTLTIAQWARHLGIKPATIQSRLRYGWPIERMLSVPQGSLERWCALCGVLLLPEGSGETCIACGGENTEPAK